MTEERRGKRAGEKRPERALYSPDLEAAAEAGAEADRDLFGRAACLCGVRGLQADKQVDVVLT